MRYTVVVFSPSDGIEVEVREYDDVALCFACGQPTVGIDDRMEAARQEGRLFGEMLMRYGSQEFRRGLLQVLRV